ncbi:MAG: hypothetical protein K6F94_09120 [Bacteroidaceae bacterium]|nr:hypothetical protein [Bacteroidaceae bacterium]
MNDITAVARLWSNEFWEKIAQCHCGPCIEREGQKLTQQTLMYWAAQRHQMAVALVLT